jgi:membrane protein
MLVSAYSLVVAPAQVARHLAGLEGLLPDPVIKLLAQHVVQLASWQKHNLDLSLALSLVLTVLSAQPGSNALIGVLDAIYRVAEKRSFLRRQAIALAITAASFVLVALALALIGLAPMLVARLPLDPVWRHAVLLLRWPGLALLMISALSALYRFGPARRGARWRWLIAGTAGATALWLAASAGFSLYVARLATYDRIYGSLGAGIVLLSWFYLTALVVLLGAEIDAFAARRPSADEKKGARISRGSQCGEETNQGTM